MIGRGHLVKHIFESYTKVVIKEGTRMVHVAPKAHSGNVHALLSNRLPPSLNMNPYEASMAATTRKSSSVFAVADHDDEEEDACDEVATFNPNSEAPENPVTNAGGEHANARSTRMKCPQQAARTSDS